MDHSNQNLMLAKVISIAAVAHSSQLDKGGNAYILHPMRLMMRLRTTDVELMQIAIMHDVIEDHPIYTIETLESEGFSKRVINGLRCMTPEKNESYEQYIRRIATNDDAVLVKLEDLRDNSDITRLKGITQKDFDRVQKYQKAFQYLTQVKKIKQSIY